MRKSYPTTPDGRYFVAKNRLWRCTDPRLDETTRRDWVSELMSARRAVRDAGDEAQTHAARARVQTAKTALGERGPVWWDDDAPDETGCAPANTRYAAWWRSLAPADRASGQD
ncbi:hypothetical protein [Salinisphaera sp. Q1T1-3]|uniref:hypothetical protein n=1 Tax=Salinisphaera sp. Q1T1-3 TaxID=2321229 RepID=UPI000E7617B3|nr:hypothetical protein [Salinisphaera sp. Q1T1-3]RJS94067.1 hypothetical protein D3260_05720 [Salinisphaera sp. Q1T1-3]